MSVPAYKFRIQLVSLLGKMEGDNVLPYLGNEKMTEQLVFEAKVRRSNIEFRRRKEDIIRFVLSNPECSLYPQSVKRNKRAFRKKVKTYTYNPEKK